MKKLMILLLLIMCSTTAFAFSLSGTEIQQNLPSGYEPSGIIWHSYYNALFVVSDGGTLSKMNTDGTSVTSWTIGGDLEGVTVVDSASQYIYMVVEYPFAVIKFDASTGTVIRTVSLTGIIPATANTNSGIEGMAYVPDGYHPYTNTGRGVFYFGVQENGKIYAVDIDFTSGIATLISSFTPVSGRTDISDLYFSIETNTLYVLYDTANIITEIQPNNALITEYSVPGYDQEGITVLPSCPTTSTTLFIAEDSGRVMKYSLFSVTCPTASPVDSDSDGVQDSSDVCSGYDDSIDTDSDGIPDGCDTVGDPYTITSYTVNSDATVRVQYADSTELTIDPFPGNTQISAGVNSDSNRLIVTDGKYVRVYKRETRSAQKKIAPSVSSSNTLTIAGMGEYDQITVQFPTGRKTATILLTLEGDTLNIISSRKA